MSLISRAVASALTTAGVVVFAILPANATTETDPFWYYNLLGFEAIHESGLTGEGVTIAVIDSALYPDVPTLEGTDLRVQESVCLDANGVPLPPTSSDYATSRHGTNVVSYLIGTGAGYEGQTGVKGVAPDATVLYFPMHDYGKLAPPCSFSTGPVHEGGSDEQEMALAMRAAVDAGVDIISVSVVGGDNDLMREAMIDAVRQGIIVVGGLGNDIGEDGAPAWLNGAVSVLGAQSNGELNRRVNEFNGELMEFNTSEYVQVVGPGWDIYWQGSDGDWTVPSTSRGTSIATPIVAGTLALAMQKYPEATGNQILQSMIHNTGTEGGEPTWDPNIGYGSVVPNTLLAANPTQYPDFNPLVIEIVPGESGPLGQGWRLPEFFEIYPDGIPTTLEPTATASPSEGPVPDAPSSNIGLIALIGGIALLVLILVIVFTVIAVNRKKVT